MKYIDREDRKKIKKRVFEAFGYSVKWNKRSLSLQYAQVIRKTICVEIPSLNEHQALIAMRHICDTEGEDYGRVLFESLTCMPSKNPQAYVDLLTREAIVSRKQQKITAPIMTEIQKRSEVINDYVHRKEVATFSSKFFYRTREWKELRLLALAARRVCCLCGNGPAQGKALHVDHIKPRSLWPELSLQLENLQILCQDCNLAKSNTITERY